MKEQRWRFPSDLSALKTFLLRSPGLKGWTGQKSQEKNQNKKEQNSKNDEKHSFFVLPGVQFLVWLTLFDRS